MERVRVRWFMCVVREEEERPRVEWVVVIGCGVGLEVMVDDGWRLGCYVIWMEVELPFVVNL